MTEKEAVETALETLVDICESTEHKTHPYSQTRINAAEVILTYSAKMG